MDSTGPEVALDFSPFFIIYKDGSIKRLMGVQTVPPSLDSQTNVQSKDVVFSQEINQSCRLYLPKNTKPSQRLPVLVYFHGGGFCIETAFSPAYHNYLNTLVSEANVIAVSVDYRRAPEHHIPVPYEDSWAALKWVASHVDEDGPEEWLNSHANFSEVVLAGDSAGANIVHHMAMRYAQEKLNGIKDLAIILIHPYFLGSEPAGNEIIEASAREKLNLLWQFACPTTKNGCDDPLINPVMDPNFASLGCSRALVLVAEKDLLRERAWHYYENLRKNGWGGAIGIMETKEEEHVFHLMKPTCENAQVMLKKIVSFIHHASA